MVMIIDANQYRKYVADDRLYDIVRHVQKKKNKVNHQERSNSNVNEIKRRRISTYPRFIHVRVSSFKIVRGKFIFR